MSKCKSCNSAIADSNKYCSQCGAKVIRERITIKRMFQDLLKLLTNLESPFIKTTATLIKSPKSVTIDYIEGKRKVITSPIRNAIIALSIYGIYQFLFQDFFNLNFEENVFDDMIKESLGVLSDISFFEVNKEAIENIKLIYFKHIQFTNFWMVPILAFVCSRAYKSSKYNYAEHISIALYAVSISLLLSVILGLFFIFFDASREVYKTLTRYGDLILMIWIVWRSYGGNLIKPILVFLISRILFFCLFAGIMILFLIK